MIILSIDPGVERVGYAVFEKTGTAEITLLESDTIQTSKKCTQSKRILSISDALCKIVKQRKPKHIVMERLFFFKNEKTVIGVAQAQGAILLLAAQNNIPVYYLTPPQIKLAITGYGNADKTAMKKMIELQIKLPKKKRLDDEIDAIGCGYSFCVSTNSLQFSE